MEFFTEHLGELMVGMVLGMFGWGFRSWSQALMSWKKTVENSTTSVLDKLDHLINDFQDHKLESERRISKLETKVEQMERKNGK